MRRIVPERLAGIWHGQQRHTGLVGAVLQSVAQRVRLHRASLAQNRAGAALDGIHEVVVSVTMHAADRHEAVSWREQARIVREAVACGTWPVGKHLRLGGGDELVEYDHCWVSPAGRMERPLGWDALGAPQTTRAFAGTRA